MATWSSKQYAWCDISVALGGRIINGITEVEYTEKIEKEKLYGRGCKPHGVVRGNRDYEGKITLWQSELEAMTRDAPNKDILNLSFDIVVSYVPHDGPEDPPTRSKFEGQVYKDGTGIFIGGKDGIWKATRPDGTKETLIPEITIQGKSSDTRAMEARMRLADAISNCKACKGVEDAERFMFMYMPMAIATGGISTKASLGVYATKASISAGTQLAIAQDVNLIKLVGDTAFNPISGAMFGNSAEYKISELMKGNFNSFSISSMKNFGIGIGADVVFMGRSGGYGRVPMPKSAQTIIGVQSELASQSMSKGLQNKYGDKK